MQSRPGSGEVSLGTLTLHEEIGSGGFGRVLRATMAPFKRAFAVKLLDPSAFNDRERARTRFLREAEILMSLRHPNITPVYGLGEMDGQPYIVMELFCGYNFVDARKKRPPSAPKVLHTMEMLTSALAEAHRCNVMHRDIKPTNVMTRKGDARLLDFGIAQLLDPEGTRLTKTGYAPAGDSFSAPELIENPKMLDPRCDIYSLAACWFYVMTGKTPRGRNWESTLRDVDGMFPSYEDVVLRALDERDRRYQTAGELKRDIESLRRGEDPATENADSLEDAAAAVLGIIFERASLEMEGITPYRIEEELSGYVSRLGLSVAVSDLKARGFVRVDSLPDDFGREYFVLNVTEPGEAWVRAHSQRVELLIEDARDALPKGKATTEIDLGEIPF